MVKKYLPYTDAYNPMSADTRSEQGAVVAFGGISRRVLATWLCATV